MSPNTRSPGISNYEIMKQQAMKLFLTYDIQSIIDKWNLEHDSDFIYIRFLTRLYRISRATGQVDCESSTNENSQTLWQEAGYNEVMVIMDVLCYSKPDCSLSGEYIQMHRLSSLQNGSTGYLGGSFYDKYAAYFDRHSIFLPQACESLRGSPYAKGDIAYVFPLFDFLPIVFQFWHSDDEFPPSVEFFMDKNTLQFMHFETIWYAASFLSQQMKERISEIQ